MTEVWVIGGGGHAKVVIATLEAAGRRVRGVFDDAPAKRGGFVLGVPVIGAVPDPAWWAAEALPAFLALGGNALRRRAADRLHPAGGWATAIHPAATVHASVTVEPGALVCAGAVIQPDVRIGAHAIINTAAVVEHDGDIGAFAHIAPRAGLAGGVTVGEGALVGIGASVVPGRRLGAWCIVGAGAAVIRDLPDGMTAVGVPARPLSGSR
ncbi:acetyltransferase [Azospirillum sp.]|uniref:acetyltransferase n=1 Tax=Azospirillum sp. TaxID=34012 RepID=UPI002D31EE23|nr:acetyltransferase [Azospirillum sp.]HYD64536.1 acetyltransferase [Azospirillum sp.]